jgi:TnpA family transposase
VDAAKKIDAIDHVGGGCKTLEAAHGTGSGLDSTIRQQLGEVMRLAESIQQGTVTASLILRKLGSYSRQNGLALALRKGRSTCSIGSRIRLSGAGSPPALIRVKLETHSHGRFFNRLGEIRDLSFENQHHRASGLNLLVAAITLWNTVCLKRAERTSGKITTVQIRPSPARFTARVGTH